MTRKVCSAILSLRLEQRAAHERECGVQDTRLGTGALGLHSLGQEMSGLAAGMGFAVPLLPCAPG